MKGMTTCKVCGRDFALMAEEHYVAQDPQRVGAIANLVSTDRALEFDAFDCPHCGCQNVMQERKATCPCDYGICDECDHPGEEEENVESHAGCYNCKYEHSDEDEKPCVLCSHRYIDRWEAKDE